MQDAARNRDGAAAGCSKMAVAPRTRPKPRSVLQAVPGRGDPAIAAADGAPKGWIRSMARPGTKQAS